MGPLETQIDRDIFTPHRSDNNEKGPIGVVQEPN